MKHLRLFEQYSNENIYYHGTDSDTYITQFESREKSNRSSRLGIFFSSDKSFAEMFGEYVYPYKLELKNPKKLTQDYWWEIRDVNNSNSWFDSYRQRLIENGYDSIIVEKDEYFSDVVIAFYPEQIKTI
jgi:hypothetical protein